MCQKNANLFLHSQSLFDNFAESQYIFALKKVRFKLFTDWFTCVFERVQIHRKSSFSCYYFFDNPKRIVKHKTIKAKSLYSESFCIHTWIWKTFILKILFSN